MCVRWQNILHSPLEAAVPTQCLIIFEM